MFYLKQHHFLPAIKGMTVSLTNLKLQSSITSAESSSGPSRVRMRMHLITKCKKLMTVLLFKATVLALTASVENSVMHS